jgi:hypothetical protein
VRNDQQGIVATLLRPIFNAADGKQARAQMTAALERLQEPLPKIYELLQEAQDDLLAFYRFSANHWPKLHSTNLLERLNRGRRTDVQLPATRDQPPQHSCLLVRDPDRRDKIGSQQLGQCAIVSRVALHRRLEDRAASSDAPNTT